jgi:transcriptional regulator with XRE-family HTH domain
VNLRREMERKRITQEKLAEGAGELSVSTISRILTGKIRNPSDDTIGRIARALNIRRASLLRGR